MSKLVKKQIYIPELLAFEMHCFNNGFVCWFSGPYYTWKQQLSRSFPFHINKNWFRYAPSMLNVGFNFFDTYRFPNLKLETQQLSLLHIQIKQLIIGASVGFKKFLRVRGVGYKFNISPTTLTIHVGYSHLLKIKYPYFKSFVTNKKATLIRGRSVNLVALSTFFAAVRFLRSPDVYKGKGIRYRKDLVIRKEGKKKKTI